MTTFQKVLAACALALVAGLAQAHAVEMKVSRQALERTLQQQLFGGPDGRYYVKGNLQSACFTYAEHPQLTFVQDRIVVKVRTHSRLGTSLRGACIGLSISVPAEVSLAPEAEGETIGFRDARLDQVSDQKQLNFILSPFLSRKVPSSMKVNAADLLRKALEGSIATAGYKVTLDRLKIHSIQIAGDSLIVDVDGDLSVQ
jgi:hypothetical protein